MKMNAFAIVLLIIGLLGTFSGVFLFSSIKEKPEVIHPTEEDKYRNILLEISPLIYPIYFNDQNLKIMTVMLESGGLVSKIHTFDLHEFIKEFRTIRSKDKAKADDEALEFIVRKCNYPYERKIFLMPVVNLMNYDLAKDFYDWSEKQLSQ